MITELESRRNAWLEFLKTAYENKNPHFWRMIPELESRRNAWLEFFKTAEDLGTDIFLSFKKSKALCKHGGGPRWLTIRGPEPESLDFLFLEVVGFISSSSSLMSVKKVFLQE
jgi:hypothetical protein